MIWSEERLATMRAAFLDALDDPTHPVWDRLLNGVTIVDSLGRSKTRGGILDEMERHPFGHDCQQCHAWRRENPWGADIEASVLARRDARHAA